MAKPTKITLFDLPTNREDKRPISPFTSRARYILNYKNLTYTTTWLELPSIEPTLKSLGIKPTIVNNGSTQSGGTKYTVPAIIDATDSSKPPVLVSDSAEIAIYLDKTYPDPEKPLFPRLGGAGAGSGGLSGCAPAVHMAVQTYIQDTIYPSMRPFVLHGILNLQTPGSHAEFLKRIGGSVDNLGPEPKPGAEHYEGILGKFKGAVGELERYLDWNDGEGEGEWFMGTKPTYTDFVIMSVLMTVRTSNPEFWEKEVSQWSGGRWGRFLGNAEGAGWFVIP